MLCVLSLVCFHNFHSLQRYKHDVLASSEGLIGPLDHPEGKIDFRRCSCTQTYKKHAAMRNFWNSALTKELLAFVDSKQPSLILPFPLPHFFICVSPLNCVLFIMLWGEMQWARICARRQKSSFCGWQDKRRMVASQPTPGIPQYLEWTSNCFLKFVACLWLVVLLC